MRKRRGVVGDLVEDKHLGFRTAFSCDFAMWEKDVVDCDVEMEGLLETLSNVLALRLAHNDKVG